MKQKSCANLTNMKTLLTLFVLFLSLLGCERGPLIEDYKIEGIGLGDSLLDYLSESEIIAEIELNKPAYNYLNDDFGEVYLYANFDNYDRMSFFVKQKDKSYIIYSVTGSISYDNKLEECFARQKEIEEEFRFKRRYPCINIVFIKYKLIIKCKT